MGSWGMEINSSFQVFCMLVFFLVLFPCQVLSQELQPSCKVKNGQALHLLPGQWQDKNPRHSWENHCHKQLTGQSKQIPS